MADFKYIPQSAADTINNLEAENSALRARVATAENAYARKAERLRSARYLISCLIDCNPTTDDMKRAADWLAGSDER